MDNALAFIANAMWCLIYLVAFIYNAKERSDLRPIIAVSLILTLGYAATQIATHWAFTGLRPSEQMEFQYLLWGGFCFAIAVSIILYHMAGNYRRFWPVNVVLVLLIVDAALNVLMHVDQNVIGLNGSGHPNSNWVKDYWWGWSAYSLISNLDSTVYAVVLFLSVGYTGGGMKRLLKGIARDLSRIVGVFDFNSKCVYKRLNTVQDMISAMPTSESKQIAEDAVAGANELLYRQDETGANYMNSIHILLNTASELALRANQNQRSLSKQTADA